MRVKVHVDRQTLRGQVIDNEPFSSYKEHVTNEILSLCGRVNVKPFTDYGSTCLEIAVVSEEPLTCSAYKEVLESTSIATPEVG